MKQSNKTSLSDIPFDKEDNDFGTERYVDGLIKFIENSSAPITIALQGEWGSGKTSLMNRLERALCSDNGPFIGISINTWEYSMLSSPEITVFRIMERLINSLVGNNEKAKKDWALFAKKAGNGLIRAIREGAKVAMPPLGVAIETLNVPTQLFNENSEEKQITLSDLKKSLEEAVKQSLTNDKRGVIVFVDDLDRLNPPVAVEILELLKNIFSLQDCIFVLAIDYDVVVKGLEPKFGKLTDKNEREFRSFFDKIIQVPFSLPVSSYRPMDFVLKSLCNIGYITPVEKKDPRINKPFQEIVEYSVGKNPRSIKRLINTLSLLSCIAQCGEDADESFTTSREGRIVNFAIVAIQVCYPKIYRMLVISPNFTEWDEDMAIRLNLTIEKEESQKYGWEDILEAVCTTDKYLEQHFKDIRSLLLLTQNTVENGGAQGASLEERIRSIIDKSSVTGISESAPAADIDQKRMIGKLHDAVFHRIKEKRHDIDRIQLKRNTGNGGFYVFLPKEGYVEVILRPQLLSDKIACELILSTQVKRPGHLLDKSFADMMTDEKVNAMFTSFDKVISPLLKEVYYFEGRTYPESGMKTYFTSFCDEQAYRCGQGWQPVHISQNVSYWINLANESLFEDKAIVDTIADIIIANYDLRVAALNL